jgi:quinolinate synthase
MKPNDLEKVLASSRIQYKVVVPEETARRACRAIERMLDQRPRRLRPEGRVSAPVD